FSAVPPHDSLPIRPAVVYNGRLTSPSLLTDPAGTRTTGTAPPHGPRPWTGLRTQGTRMFKHLGTALIAWLLLFGGPLPAQAHEAIRLAANPGLSPDGTTLAFDWNGDL